MSAAEIETTAAHPPSVAPVPTLPAPTVRHGVLDGEPVVYVSLGGPGAGHEMIVDADRWLMIVDLWGASWLLSDPEPTVGYVVSDRDNQGRVAKAGIIQIETLLTNATDKQNIIHQSLNRLDMRESNLLVYDRDPPRSRKGAMRAPEATNKAAKRKPRAPRPPKLPPRAWVPVPWKASPPPAASPAPIPARRPSPSQLADRRVCVYLTPDARAAFAGVQAFLSRPGCPAGRSAAISYALRFTFSTLTAAGVLQAADDDLTAPVLAAAD